MKIDKITLYNYRQFQGLNTIDLSTDGEKNIILIGGKNGYGKTNFLVSLVWCLYGEDIAKIDDNFKREIQKDNNYSRFLKGSMNWDAEKNGENQFWVEIEISDMELPETIEVNSERKYKCRIKRSCDFSRLNSEELEIKIDDLKLSHFYESDPKIFVNDYLIPIEAAKFVFFDAEKIASWAELSTKEEGSVLNDALGKILGLDTYENLINDLEIYTDGLRKESATSIAKQEINSVEKGILHNTEEIEKKEKEIFDREKTLQELRIKVLDYENYLAKQVNKNYNSVNLNEIYSTQKELRLKEKDLEIKFNQLSELIPFAIAIGKLEEVTEHLYKQELDSTQQDQKKELIDKNNSLLEKLFNNPPFPFDGDISFSKKMFYAEKAKKIVEEIFGDISNVIELDFEHDFSKSDKDLIHETFQYMGKQSKDIFEQTIDSFNRVKNEISDIERLIIKIESDQQDEDIIKYTNNKKDVERKIEKLIEEKGAIQNQASQLKKIIESDNLRLQTLIKKIEVSEQKRRKLEKANQYIQALKSFIKEQKRNKCATLETAIFYEMQKLMHKLQDNSNQSFIAGVKAEPLPDNDGLKITLIDKDGVAKHKESLSQGEKQIYISSLIKAILSLSIQEYPIFIDTPLGRLDDDHIRNILLNYYPDLASQVVLMATNNEIPPSRFKLMQRNVAQTYILECKNNITNFKQGYYTSYENYNK